MAGKNTAAFGIFPSRARAEQAVDALIAAGFRADDISVLAPDQQTTHQMATEKNTKAPEGTTTGVTAGGAIGGTLGLLAGIGALAIPGLGPFIAAGFAQLYRQLGKPLQDYVGPLCHQGWLTRACP